MSRFKDLLIDCFEGDAESALLAAVEVYRVKNPTWEAVEHNHMVRERRFLLRRYNKNIRPGEGAMLPKTTTWTEFNRCMLEQIEAGNPRVMRVFPRPRKNNPLAN